MNLRVMTYAEAVQAGVTKAEIEAVAEWHEDRAALSSTDKGDRWRHEVIAYRLWLLAYNLQPLRTILAA